MLSLCFVAYKLHIVKDHSLDNIVNIEDILQPNEELEYSSNLMAIYSMTMDEVEALEAQTHPTGKQAFKDRNSGLSHI